MPLITLLTDFGTADAYVGEVKGVLLSRVPAATKSVDIGGDHRYVEGWTYGLADVWPDEIRGKSRVANPGCYPTATLTALAPLLAEKLIEPTGIIIDAIRAAKIAKDRGIGGALLSASSYLMKSPPEQRPDDLGRAKLEAFIAGTEER